MFDLNLLFSTGFESMASALALQCSTKYIKYSTNWPAPNVWVFMAQLVEHCRTNAAAMGLNPFKALELFSGLNSQLLKRIQLQWSHLHLQSKNHVFNWVLMYLLQSLPYLPRER